MKFAFAGDRDIAVWVLKFILESGYKPKALFLSSRKKASHADELINLCYFLDEKLVFRGTEFRSYDSIKILKELDLDYIIGIHFPYIVPDEVLKIPKEGVINLHPAFLPFNRGWHTPSWAILENTPIGATLHFMNSEVDLGDIIYQKELEVLAEDTANSLYMRIKKLELNMFKEAWPMLLNRSYKRNPQNPAQGTLHKKSDLSQESISNIDMKKSYLAEDLIRRLRALTTNNINEAAYYHQNGKKYRIQVIIEKDNS